MKKTLALPVMLAPSGGIAIDPQAQDAGEADETSELTVITHMSERSKQNIAVEESAFGGAVPHDHNEDRTVRDEHNPIRSIDRLKIAHRTRFMGGRFKVASRSIRKSGPMIFFSFCTLIVPVPSSGQEVAPIERPIAGYFPEQLHAPQGAPNVLIIMTDDVGFAASSTFGGPIPTPTFDQLAKDGLRFNRFHTTGLCSPTRAALLTGRNHHAVGSGVITEIATADVGYTSVIPKSAATIGEVLRQNGYSTSWFGKNHNTPDWETGPHGPFDRWPVGLGFDYFFGFNAGDTNQWAPALVENTTTLEPPTNDPVYILDRDLADRAVRWLQVQRTTQPGKPFLMYFAPGTAHAPNHAPQEWIGKFESQFDLGWDQMREKIFSHQIAEGIVPSNAELTPRPNSIPAWEALSHQQQRLYARMMEVYAAALAFSDAQIGRVIEELRASGQLDNTIIVYIQGDNGAGEEGGLDGTTNEFESYQVGPQPLSLMLSRYDELGGPQTYGTYPVGWAWAMSTPFQWLKQIASHFGATRNGMVLSWPGRIEQPGGIRSQFAHVVDIAPTLYEAIGIPMPSEVGGTAQQPLDGTSLVYALNNSEALGRHNTQYFEMLGNRAIYHGGWIASTTPGRAPWEFSTGIVDPNNFAWELYDLENDFSQAHDLAQQYPARLQQMRKKFAKEASQNRVLPLMASTISRLSSSNRPYPLNGRSEFTFLAGPQRYPRSAFPDITNRSWTISAEIEIEAGSSKGVLVTQGGRFGGWALLIRGNGKPTFVYKRSTLPDDLTIVQGTKDLSPGKHEIRADFSYEGGGKGKGGTLTLSVDGAWVGQARIKQTAFALFSLEGAAIGHDTETPVLEDYGIPFPFEGKIKSVQFVLR